MIGIGVSVVYCDGSDEWPAVVLGSNTNGSLDLIVTKATGSDRLRAVHQEYRAFVPPSGCPVPRPGAAPAFLMRDTWRPTG